MSHITQIKVKVELKNENTLNRALRIMQKEGYMVLKDKDKTIIDLTDRCKHSYGAEWTRITLKKNDKTGIFEVTGDPWSIRDHFNTAVNTLQKSYQVASVEEFFSMKGFMKGTMKTEQKTDASKIGRVKITGTKL